VLNSSRELSHSTEYVITSPLGVSGGSHMMDISVGRIVVALTLVGALGATGDE